MSFHVFYGNGNYGIRSCKIRIPAATTVMQRAPNSELTLWESPTKSMYDVILQEWMRSPLTSLLDRPTPCLPAGTSRHRTATTNADDADSHPRCICNKCISDKCVAWPEVHSLRLRRVLRAMTACTPECSSRHEWIMNATAVSKPRYSAAVNATPRSFFPLLFFP